MKRLVLCMVKVRRRDYVSDREYEAEYSLKQVWVGPDENLTYVVEQHYKRLSDTYGARLSVLSVEEVETIGSP